MADLQPWEHEAQMTKTLHRTVAESLPEGLRCKLYQLSTPAKRCDPIFSSPSGQEPEKTRLSSHFLAVTVYSSPSNAAGDGRDEDQDVLVFAIEVLIYTTKHLTTLFVSKADSTGYLHSAKPPQASPSPLRTFAVKLVQRLIREQRQKYPGRKLVVSLFARSQSEYLFPGSGENKRKHILDDRGLIKWWCRTLTGLFPPQEVYATGNLLNDGEKVRGYLTVPGFGPNEVLRRFVPSADDVQLRWSPGHPLVELGRTRRLRLDDVLPPQPPPRCLLPRFPDDPKARYMQELDDESGLAEDNIHGTPSKRRGGEWTSVKYLERFWEAMEFRQECSSGRCVGFIWIVFPPLDPAMKSADSQEADEGVSQVSAMSALSSSSMLSSAQSSPKKQMKGPLTGPIVARKARLKLASSTLSATSRPAVQRLESGMLVTKDGYDHAMQTLLHLDFATRDVAAQSTSKWIREITLAADSTSGWGQEVTGTLKVVAPAANGTSNGDGTINDLGGVLKKKRKLEDSVTTSQPAGESKPAVNSLGSGTVRKKPKSVT